MKTAEEVKRGLECCTKEPFELGICQKCPYYPCEYDEKEKDRDALAYIRQLEAERDGMLQKTQQPADHFRDSTKMAEIIAKDDNAILVELAEECSELAQAALKLVRIRCGRSPEDETVARASLIEEMADVNVMWSAALKQLQPTEEMCLWKMANLKERRMRERLGNILIQSRA